jgi:hypothetical protein
MATRARIGLELADGTITTSYHHWDGYPAGLGFNLVNNWNTADKIAPAIALGDASHWGTKIGDKIDFDVRGDGYYEQNVYYHRDRGEPQVNTSPITYESYAVFEKVFMRNQPAGEDYAYILRQDGTFTQVHPYTNEIKHDAEDSIRAEAARMQRLIDQEAA